MQLMLFDSVAGIQSEMQEQACQQWRKCRKNNCAGNFGCLKCITILLYNIGGRALFQRQKLNGFKVSEFAVLISGFQEGTIQLL